MNATFKQYAPADLYINVAEPETLEADSDMDQTTGFRAIGGAFLNAFIGNLHYLDIHTADFHASKLGVPRVDFCFAVQTLTGMTFTDFTTEYILLMAADLLKEKRTDKKGIAKRLGFGSYSGFYRFMLRNGQWEKKRR